MTKKALIIVLLTFGVLFGGYFSIVTYIYPDLVNRGQFGDMFGGMNALFSGLAFLGVIYAMWLQREELELQRRELELTRRELKRTAAAQEKSEKALSKQAESLKLTAKLNGLSSLMQLYIARRDVGIAKYGHGGVERQWEEKASEIERQIQQIINEK
jgi:hypothetical protein